MRTHLTARELIVLAYMKQYGSTKGMIKQKPKVYFINGDVIVLTKAYDSKLRNI